MVAASVPDETGRQKRENQVWRPIVFTKDTDFDKLSAFCAEIVEPDDESEDGKSYLRFSIGRTYRSSERMRDPKTNSPYRVEFDYETSRDYIRTEIESVIGKAPERMREGVSVFIEALRVGKASPFKAFDAEIRLPNVDAADELSDKDATTWRESLFKQITEQSKALTETNKALVGQNDRLTNGIVMAMAKHSKLAFKLGKFKGYGAAFSAVSLQSTIDKAVDRGLPTLEKVILAAMQGPDKTANVSERPAGGTARIEWNADQIAACVNDIIKTAVGEPAAMTESVFAKLFNSVGTAAAAINQFGTEKGWVK